VDKPVRLCHYKRVMLRINQSTNSSEAKRYYNEGLSREDYYAESQEIVGEWGGKLAERLGLSGTVGKDHFAALCDNKHPLTQGKLSLRTNDNRTVGYDFNFHSPKSVSALFALNRDEQILHAFRESVKETMQTIEADMQTRVRLSGAYEDRKTGNLVWAEFVHFTARPVNDLPDFHLHCHCYTHNFSYDSSENRIKAGQFRDIKRDAPYYEAVFHSVFAKKIIALGYPVERKGAFWEVANVPQSVVEKFSRRTAEIEKTAKEKNITDAKAKDALGAKTRANKRKGLALDRLRVIWTSWLSESEKAALAQAKMLGGNSPDITPKQSMDYALEHSFERASVISERQLLTTALRRGVGFVSVADMNQEAKRSDILSKTIDGRIYATTKKILAEEKAMITLVRNAKGTATPLVSNHIFLDGRLSDEQKNVVSQLLSSRDCVIALRGVAGTGKTTLMRETIAAIEANGKKVSVFAPSAQASRGVLRLEGFENAETVASLLSSKAKQLALRGQVLWIDEAGQMGAKTLRNVLDIAEKQNARVILSGDTKQHGAVERGDALKILEHYAGLKTAELSSIRRQRGTYKEAVEDMSKGNIEAGFAKLELMGAITEINDGNRYEKLANDYVQTMNQGKTALAIAPTHKEGENVTNAIRANLQSSGKLKNEKTFPQLTNLSWTQAERSDAINYSQGLVVQFHHKTNGFERTEKLTVRDVSSDKVMVERGNGDIMPLPLKETEKFAVYKADTVKLAVGDKVRIMQNGTTMDSHRLNNGAVFAVSGFTKNGDIKLHNNWVVKQDYGHLSHGYCLTSHASQGVTVDRVFIAQSAAASRASSREQFYVSVSRGREDVKIYTDDKHALKDSVLGSSSRMAAVELLKNPSRISTKEMVEKQVRLVNRLARQTQIFASRIMGKVKETLAMDKQGMAKSHPQKNLRKGIEYDR
jgi:conjugative relaxase-like TrwC/TraI family protein